MDEVGTVFTYFSKVGVAGIKITNCALKIGDKICIQGHTTSIEQVVDSLQLEGNNIEEASIGSSVGIKVTKRVRPKDIVYRID